MSMTRDEMQRKITQATNDVNEIYLMLSTISMTQSHHGRMLVGLEAKVDEVETRLTGRLAAVDTRLDGIDGRLDGIDGRLDGIDGRLEGMDSRLDGLTDGMAEILRRLPA